MPASLVVNSRPSTHYAVYAKYQEQPVADDLVSNPLLDVIRADVASHKVAEKSKSDSLDRSLIRHNSEKLATILLSYLEKETT